MGAGALGRAAQQVEREDQQEEVRAEQPHRPGKRAPGGLRQREPGLVAVEVRRVGVVDAMAEAPAVVGHEQRRVKGVAEGVVEARAAREGAVAAVVADDEERPEERPLQEPERQQQPRRAGARGQCVERRQRGQVYRHVAQRAQRRPLEAARGNRGAQLGQCRKVRGVRHPFQYTRRAALRGPEPPSAVTLAREVQGADHDPLLRALKLPAQGRQSGGRDREALRNEVRAGAGRRRHLRRRGGRQADLLQARGPPLSRGRRDPDAARGTGRLASASRRSA